MAESDKLNIDNIIARLLEGKATHLPSLRGGVMRQTVARVTLCYTFSIHVFYNSDEYFFEDTISFIFFKLFFIFFYLSVFFDRLRNFL